MAYVIAGDTPGEVSRNQLAFKNSDDERSAEVANELQQFYRARSENQLGNKAIDAENYRWQTPNATADRSYQNQLAMARMADERERMMWQTPNATMKEQMVLPYERGMTPAQQAEIDLKTKEVENQFTGQMLPYALYMGGGSGAGGGGGLPGSGLWQQTVMQGAEARRLAADANGQLAAARASKRDAIQKDMDTGAHHGGWWDWLGGTTQDYALRASPSIANSPLGNQLTRTLNDAHISVPTGTNPVDVLTPDELKQNPGSGYRATRNWFNHDVTPGLAEAIRASYGPKADLFRYNNYTLQFEPNTGYGDTAGSDTGMGGGGSQLSEGIRRVADMVKSLRSGLGGNSGPSGNSTNFPVVLPMPSSRTNLVTGQNYQTSRGAATWNGTQFVQ